jgi:hypothetical protein
MYMSSLDIRLSADVLIVVEVSRPRNADALAFGPPEVLGLAGMAKLTGALLLGGGGGGNGRSI